MAIQGPWTIEARAIPELLASGLLQYEIEANRPAAGEAGRKFIASDTCKVYRDTGSAWETVLDVDAGTSTPSLRTLGTGSQQAAAGDHSHS